MGVLTETVPAAAWREHIARRAATGARFGGLFAAHGEVRAVFTSGSHRHLVRAAVPGGRIATVVDLVPAGWDEREAADLHGVRFDGHEPARALVRHPDDRALWATPVTGDDVHRVPVGPIHAGIIESGHFLFHVVGERVLHVDARLFHKHRGLERAAEGRSPQGAVAVLSRTCGGCAVANAVAVCAALEEAMGLAPDEPLRRSRTLLVELERMWNHLNDVAQICAGVGLSTGSMLFAAFKERTQRVCADLTGHRFMFDAVAPAASPEGPAGAERGVLRAEVASIAADAARAARQLLFDASLRDRTANVGAIGPAEARALGICGPAARASGLALDARLDAPTLWYPGFAVVLPPHPVGDVSARLEARWVELAQSAAIVDDLLASPLPPGAARARGDADGHGVGVVESPRGETVCAVELDRGVVRRVRLRTGSYANWPGVAFAATRAILPDFPLVNKSFELCYACVDR